jgi:hypothetical protein
MLRKFHMKSKIHRLFNGVEVVLNYTKVAEKKK